MIIFKVLRKLYWFLASYTGSKKATFLNSEQTIQAILENRKSLIRYGDGEFMYMLKDGICYQEKDERLQDYLKRILTDYLSNQKNCPYYVGMPVQFFNCKGNVLLKNYKYFSCWTYSRYIFKKFFDKDVLYADAFTFAAKYQQWYVQLWKNAPVENIILVHNDEKYLDSIKKDCDKQCAFVKIPSKNAFSEFESILRNIKDTANQVGSNNAMVLISAGPCAKALVYELSKCGIWAIDTGHCFCDPLEIME